MMTTLPTDYSHQQLVDALVADYAFYIHDTYDEEFDNNEDKFREYLLTLSHSELINETCTDDTFTLQEYMRLYG